MQNESKEGETGKAALWGKDERKRRERQFFVLLFAVVVLVLLHLLLGGVAFSESQIPQIPGSDASDKLEAAGTVLRLIDTAVFKWGARLMAGVSIMSAAWALKEQRFGIAVICILGALLFGTAPQWVRNIFAIADSDSVFGELAPTPSEGLARVGTVVEATSHA